MNGAITPAGTLTGELTGGYIIWVELSDGESLIANENNEAITVNGGVSGGDDSHLKGALSVDESLSGELTTAEREATPTYEGEYEITPTQSTQTIPIGGLKATSDITVNPIPSNYGLITWNGSTLTVS